ncbi:hypothetical protein FGIG_01231 [Fasciola gigantica]|uniref:Uncharacterized protein n=1 Tax=Fasciola gigantica TaxID=46835 RepID=A0A504Z659_FASGI|nr:hypothetical protein FGIG_01231 [Fasciola gigantica]
MAYVGRCVYCSRFERNLQHRTIWAKTFKHVILPSLTAMLFFPFTGYHSGPFNVQLFGIQKEIHISLMYLIVIPLSIAFGLLWFALRQDPRIGYPLQCILATFIVQFVLSYDFILPSMKQLSILFLFVLPFEIVDKIVFPMLNIGLLYWEMGWLGRWKINRIIETLLSHSLGFDGSSLPGGFRISVAHFTGWENGNCSYLEYNGLLPFAHVLLPGLICALFMLHDCQQQVRYCRNFSASVIGEDKISVLNSNNFLPESNPQIIIRDECQVIRYWSRRCRLYRRILTRRDDHSITESVHKFLYYSLPPSSLSLVSHTNSSYFTFDNNKYCFWKLSISLIRPAI